MPNTSVITPSATAPEVTAKDIDAVRALLDEFRGEFLQFLRREGQLDFDEVEPAGQALEVLRHAEGPPVDDAHGLEQTVAEQETAIIDGNDRFGFR